MHSLSIFVTLSGRERDSVHCAFRAFVGSPGSPAWVPNKVFIRLTAVLAPVAVDVPDMNPLKYWVYSDFSSCLGGCTLGLCLTFLSDTGFKFMKRGLPGVTALVCRDSSSSALLSPVAFESLGLALSPLGCDLEKTPQRANV